MSEQANLNEHAVLQSDRHFPGWAAVLSALFAGLRECAAYAALAFAVPLIVFVVDPVATDISCHWRCSRPTEHGLVRIGARLRRRLSSWLVRCLW